MYQQRITAYAGMRHLDVWYDHISVNDVLSALTAAKQRHGVGRIAAKARGKDHLRAYRKLTTTIDGQVRIVDDPPIVDHVDVPDDVLPQSRAQLLRS
jgi:Trk K+ transport system NAD-binding subunit